MPELSAAMEAAIEKLVAHFQQMGDQERVESAKREKIIAAHKEAVPKYIQSLKTGISDLAKQVKKDDEGQYDFSEVDPKSLAAFVSYMQQPDEEFPVVMARFDSAFPKQVGQYLQSLAQADPAGIDKINEAAKELASVLPQEKIEPPQVDKDQMYMEPVVIPPEGEDGKWEMTLIPVVFDDDFNASVPETLEYDLYLTILVTPHEGLSAEFNAPGVLIKAGETFEPLVVTYEGKKNPTIQAVGQLWKDGQLVNPMILPPMTLAPVGQNPANDAAALDADALAEFLGGDKPGAAGGAPKP